MAFTWKIFEQVHELVDELKDFLLQENNDLAAYQSENEFLLKLAYLCDVFAKLNKLNVSMQRPDKNVLDISDKIEAFIKKLSVWKNDIKYVSGSSQYFTFLFTLLEKKSMMLPSNLRSVFVQHLSKLDSKFSKYFPENLSDYEWIRNPFDQPCPSSFSEQEKEDYIDLTCDNSLKKKFNSGNPTKFWISLNGEYSAWTEKALRMIIPFATLYLCEAGFSAMAVIKTKYQTRINVERDIRVAVSKILPRFDELFKNNKHTHHIKM